VVYGAGVVIRSSRVQGLHPATSGICFSVVPSSNPRSRFVANWSVSYQLGFLTMLCSFEMFVPLFQWHACELAELSACRAKCMTTINMIYIYIFTFLHFSHTTLRSKASFKTQIDCKYLKSL